MVTCNLIGRTGNQMFIIAATIAYAKRYGLDYHIPACTQNNQWKPAFIHLQHPNFNYRLTKWRIFEKHFHYHELPAPPSEECNIELNGYFQSDKYFFDYLDDIRRAFNIPYIRENGWSVIHYRSGDYKQLQDYHPIVSKYYLLNAVNLLVERGCKRFIILSDEMDEAANVLDTGSQPYSTIFDFSKTKSEFEDLSLGSSCDHIIGSNSSFSLWMYYLNRNKNKIGIFPQKWFGPKLPHNTKDLVPAECIIL